MPVLPKLTTDNILGRVEYRYTQYGNKNYDLAGTTVTQQAGQQDIRVGIGYKF